MRKSDTAVVFIGPQNDVLSEKGANWGAVGASVTENRTVENMERIFKAAKAKGYEVTISFPKEGIGTAAEGIALIKGAKNPELGKKLIDWATSPAMQNNFAKYKINFVPAHPDVVLEPGLAVVLKGAKIFPIDADYAGANRKRIVDRWVAEVLNP